MLESGLPGLKLGVKLTPFVACIVDTSLSYRAVHCPAIPFACPAYPCQPIHFSYAIPVRIEEFGKNFAELALELPTDRKLSSQTHLRSNIGHKSEMAATAKAPKTAVRCEPEEDIAAIAKQISDHAEAIYQTWKSRGLAPTEILKCHNSETAAGKFGSALTPQPRSPPIELLSQAPTMDNNRLERLVTNFVTEDKARLAAQKGRTAQIVSNTSNTSNKPIPSSIQYALQKFEKNNTDKKIHFQQSSPTKIQFPSVQPNSRNQNHLDSHHPSVQHETVRTVIPHHQQPEQPEQPEQPAVVKPVQKPQISPKPKFSQTDTIEFTLPVDIIPSNPQSWPLKNRIVGKETMKQRKLSEKTATLEEVALEEKRLIHALKNGVVLSHDKMNKFASPNEMNSTRWGPRTIRRSEQQVPHPELTNIQKQHLRQVQIASPNPVRPFLTRGSVAERVLIFERCPSELMLDKRIRAPTVPKFQTPTKQLLAHTTLQRHVKANRNVLIPRFYYPQGKPVPTRQLEDVKQQVISAFTELGDRTTREQFSTIIQACDLPMYWKVPLFLASGGDNGFVTKDKFLSFWQILTTECHDSASKFVHILTRGKRHWLCPEDFIPLVQDVVETHPGLTFLKEAAEFHSRYVHTVIARIYYCVNRTWSGRITLSELRRSNLLSVIRLLEEEEDINQITAYFSYEHFYVIYCKFWELDRDHDLFIDKEDLTRHNDHALSTRIIERIFSGAVTRGQHKLQHEEKMSYTEFVWFLLSEEDKTHPTAIEYWFRCMDFDGDGYLSMYELEYFYDEQMQRMEAIGIETLPFQDCLCQMLDMVKPKIKGKISLSDLKLCKMTPIFFDTFFNLEKYLDHEQRDPFASQRDHDVDGHEMSDWDRYAAEEYELLVAEEGNGDQQDSISLDEEPEGDEDLLSPNLDVILNDVFESSSTKANETNVLSNAIINSDGEEDDYDEGDYASDSDECSI